MFSFKSKAPVGPVVWANIRVTICRPRDELLFSFGIAGRDENQRD